MWKIGRGEWWKAVEFKYLIQEQVEFSMTRYGSEKISDSTLVFHMQIFYPTMLLIKDGLDMMDNGGAKKSFNMDLHFFLLVMFQTRTINRKNVHNE